MADAATEEKWRLIQERWAQQNGGGIPAAPSQVMRGDEIAADPTSNRTTGAPAAQRMAAGLTNSGPDKIAYLRGHYDGDPNTPPERSNVQVDKTGSIWVRPKGSDHWLKFDAEMSGWNMKSLQEAGKDVLDVAGDVAFAIPAIAAGAATGANPLASGLVGAVSNAVRQGVSAALAGKDTVGSLEERAKEAIQAGGLDAISMGTGNLAAKGAKSIGKSPEENLARELTAQPGATQEGFMAWLRDVAMPYVDAARGRLKTANRAPSEQAAENAALGKEMSMEFMPDQLAQTRTAVGIGDALREHPATASTIEKVDTRNLKQLYKKSVDFLDGLGSKLGAGMAGTNIAKAYENRKQALISGRRAFAEPAYNEAFASMGTKAPVIEMRASTDIIRPLLDEYTAPGAPPHGKAIANYIKEHYADLTKLAESQADPGQVPGYGSVTPRQMQNLMSMWKREVREAKDGLPPDVKQRVDAQILAALKQDLDVAAEKGLVRPEGMAKLQAANRQYAEQTAMIEDFIARGESKFGEAMKLTPGESYIDRLRRAEASEVGPIMDWLDATDKQTANDARRAVIEDILEKSAFALRESGEKVYRPNGIAKSLGEGDNVEKLRMLLPKNKHEELNKILQVARILGDRPPPGSKTFARQEAKEMLVPSGARALMAPKEEAMRRAADAKLRSLAKSFTKTPNSVESITSLLDPSTSSAVKANAVLQLLGMGAKGSLQQGDVWQVPEGEKR